MDLYDVSIAKKLAGASGGGSSDFSTATVDISITGDFTVYVSQAFDDGEVGSAYPVITESGTYDIILYEGHSYALVDGSPTISVSGEIENQSGEILIFGAGEIDITDGK